MQTHRSRFWCLTENRDPDALVQALEQEGLPPHIVYLCGQFETAPDTGRKHFQGYCELDAHQRISWMKKNLSQTAHFEPRYGTQEEAIGYTQKPDSAIPDTWVEFGELETKNPGKRNDLLEVKAKLDEGATSMQIADEHFGSWIRYHRAFEQYCLMLGNNEPRVGPCETILIIGPSGSGKTTYVENCLVDSDLATRTEDGACIPGKDVYIKTPQTSWWDDYHGQSVIWLEEHNSAWFKWDTLLRILDPKGLPISVEVKGGHRQFRGTQIVITCNVPPEFWYKPPRCYEALYRRIGTTVRFQEDHTFTKVDGYVPLGPRNALPEYDVLPHRGFN